MTSATYDDTKTPTEHYATLAAALDQHGVKSVLMFGLGNGAIPALLPDVTFDAVESYPYYQVTRDNIRNVSISDIKDVSAWPRDPNGGYDALVSDIDKADPFLTPCLHKKGLNAISERLTRNGVYLALAYRNEGSYVVEMRVREV